MTLQQLAYFLATAEHGSFTAAARALGLARPSVSEQVAQLEAELGAALFVRGGRRLRLTDAGQRLRPDAQRTLAAADDALDAVQAARTLSGGQATLGAFSTAHRLIVTGLVERFVELYPKVAIRVVSGNSGDLADAVRAGLLEAALVALPIDDTSLAVGEPIAELEVVHVTRGGGPPPPNPMSIEQLACRPLVIAEAHRGDGDPTRRQLADRAQRAGVRLQPRIEVEHVDTALELTRRGFGDTVMTQALVGTCGGADGLTLTPFEPPLWECFAFVRRPAARLTPATRAVLALAEERLVETAEREPACRSGRDEDC